MDIVFLAALVDFGGSAFEDDVIKKLDNEDMLMDYFKDHTDWNAIHGYFKKVHARINSTFGEEVVLWDTKKGIRTFYRLSDRYFELLKNKF